MFNLPQLLLISKLFSNIHYDKLIIFILQDLYLNMPFQSWELRPHTTNSCLFTLIAAIIELEIEIKVQLPTLTTLYISN